METIKINDCYEVPENYTGIVEYSNGAIYYYLNSKLHREDGPAKIYPSGTVFYFINGLRHREDGPAEIWDDGSILYYLNGLCHREDGPAEIWNDGTIFYYLNNNDITEEVEEWIKENNIPKVWNKSHKLLFKLTFG